MGFMYFCLKEQGNKGNEIIKEKNNEEEKKINNEGFKLRKSKGNGK